MSTFIVISVKDSLNWIVDGIKECRPHNPDVVTYLSAGKIKTTGTDEYLYEYITYAKHAGDGGADETLAKKVETDTPRNLFTNQIAQVLNVSENEGEQINVFLLDNPMTEEDFEHSSWISNEIKEVYNSHFATNFQLVRVLFSYEIDNPANVTRQVSGMILNNLIRYCSEYSDGFLTKILYLDNQNRNGAAICLNKEQHDLMLPRMLCDLMMLLSNKDDSYMTGAAINSHTGVFSVGYAECMYYHDDVFRYYKLAGRRDLLKFVLEDKNDVEVLDFNAYPFGLKDRLQRLSFKYERVPFVKDIRQFAGNIDGLINNVLHSFAEDIAEIKTAALEAADQADKDATDEVRKARLQELAADEGISEGDVPLAVVSEESLSLENRKGCNFLYRLFGKKTNPVEVVVDPRVADIVVTEARDRVQNEYPDFISREIIYEQHMIEMDEGEDYTGETVNDNINKYLKLITFISSSVFKQFLKNKYGDSWIQKKHDIESIFAMQKEREDYFRLKERSSELCIDLDRLNNELHEFILTSHCSSVDNLIDMDKLKACHQNGLADRISYFAAQWNESEDKRWETLEKILNERIKWELYDFYYIKWNRPFEFLKDINLTAVCKRIKAKSQPFVNTYSLATCAEDLTSYYFYSDNQNWVNEINGGSVDVNVQTSALFSSHICSKLCMFQFLQLTQDLISGLVDCYESVV